MKKNIEDSKGFWSVLVFGAATCVLCSSGALSFTISVIMAIIAVGGLIHTFLTDYNHSDEPQTAPVHKEKAWVRKYFNGEFDPEIDAEQELEEQTLGKQELEVAVEEHLIKPGQSVKFTIIRKRGCLD